MADVPQVVAKVAEQGGAVVAGSAWLVWLNGNSGAVVAACAVFGAACSGVGFLVGWYYRHQAYTAGRRHGQRRRSR